MRISASALWVALPLLAGCDQFVTPPVLCEESTLKFNQTTSPTRVGLPCTFADWQFTVVHSPQVNSELSKASNLTLVGAPVSVAQGSGAVRLCPGVGDPCQGGASVITATIGEDGALKYQGVLSAASAGVDLQPGGTFTWSGLLATESYGPGNSCRLLTELSLTCQKKQE
ncbi:MAG: hypothetical protein ACYC8T_01725 [Myxococcaceae bacterium]